MKNLLVWQKLALLGAVFLVPLIVVTYALLSSVQSLGIATARHELLGKWNIRRCFAPNSA